MEVKAIHSNVTLSLFISIHYLVCKITEIVPNSRKISLTFV